MAEEKCFKRRRMIIKSIFCALGFIAAILLLLIGFWQFSFVVEQIFLIGIGAILMSLCLGFWLKVTDVTKVEITSSELIIYRSRKGTIKVDKVTDLIAVHRSIEGNVSSTFVYEKNGEVVRLVSNWFEGEKDLISILAPAP